MIDFIIIVSLIGLLRTIENILYTRNYQVALFHYCINMKRICSFNLEASSRGVLAPRVIADGSRVLGMNVNASSETNNLVRWETNMKVEVSKLATTNNGGVVAVMTNDQFLSILRGMDGLALVSRNIEAKGHEEGGELVISMLTSCNGRAASLIYHLSSILYSPPNLIATSFCQNKFCWRNLYLSFQTTV